MQNKNNSKNGFTRQNFLKKISSGYTIVETMIAVSLFIIVVMIAMGSLLNANLLREKSQNMRSIIDNLSFMMDDMSRNLRTGINYHCLAVGDNDFSSLGNAQSCASNGWAIAFKSAYGGGIWVYKIESIDSGVTFNISKSVEGGVGGSWVQLNPNEIVIDPVASGFSVLGAEPPPGDTQQPLVTIKLVGKIIYKNIESPFSLQTSVSQRIIDI